MLRASLDLGAGAGAEMQQSAAILLTDVATSADARALQPLLLVIAFMVLRVYIGAALLRCTREAGRKPALSSEIHSASS